MVAVIQLDRSSLRLSFRRFQIKIIYLIILDITHRKFNRNSIRFTLNNEFLNFQSSFIGPKISLMLLRTKFSKKINSEMQIRNSCLLRNQNEFRINRSPNALGMTFYASRFQTRYFEQIRPKLCKRFTHVRC